MNFQYDIQGNQNAQVGSPYNCPAIDANTVDSDTSVKPSLNGEKWLVRENLPTGTKPEDIALTIENVLVTPTEFVGPRPNDR